MFMISVLAVFTIKGEIGFWVLLIMALKELLLIFGAYLLYADRGDIIPANAFGKLSTIIFYIASLSIMLNVLAGHLLMIIFVLFNLASLFIYCLRFMSIKKAI